MYLLEKLDGENAREAARRKAPFGPGFSEQEIMDSDTLEIWATTFDDRGPDYCEFKLMADGVALTSRILEGY